MTYIGRFAPSPSGPLHMGSLLAAIGSALDALHHNGSWLLRMEDLDPQRSKAEFEHRILEQLDAHGLTVPLAGMMRQSTRTATYRAALAPLQARGLLFACDCTRAQRLAQADACCERRCRDTQRDPEKSALRADLTQLLAAEIKDHNLGRIFFDPARHRDVVVWRRDGVAAYHLAVVVDDAAQGVTDVVRGADLADSVPWQYALQTLLGLPIPRYLHLPVLTDADGRKLSKRDHAAPIGVADAPQAIRNVLRWLRQDAPPPGLTVKEILRWSASRWAPDRFQGITQLPIP